MRRVRLAPNTAVAHSAATASTMPSSAVPTGCPSAAPLQRAPDPDQRGGGGRPWPRPGPRPPPRRHRRPRAAAQQPGITHRGPDRQRDHRGHRGQRAEQEDQRIEGHRARRRNGDPRLAHRGQRGHQHRQQHGPGGTRRADQRARTRATSTNSRGRRPTADRAG